MDRCSPPPGDLGRRRALIEDPARSPTWRWLSGRRQLHHDRLHPREAGAARRHRARPPPDRIAAPASAAALRRPRRHRGLGPDATPRQVADAANVSLQAAWKALATVRPGWPTRQRPPTRSPWLKMPGCWTSWPQRPTPISGPGHDHLRLRHARSTSPPPTPPPAAPVLLGRLP